MLVLFDKRKQLIPPKIWLETVNQIEEGARQQALNLSRAPQACKSMDYVMERQADRVDIQMKLRPMGVIRP